LVLAELSRELKELNDVTLSTWPQVRLTT